MRLPRYEEYKDSGISALGAIPSDWTSDALKRVVSLIESGVSVNAVDEPAVADAVGVLKTSCVYSGSFDPSENKAVVEEELSRVACPVKAGTLIVSRMNTPALVGAAGLVTEGAEHLFLPDRLWQVHLSGALPKFAHYWTLSPSYRAQVQMACAGTSSSMQNLSQDEFLRFALPLPSREEQAAIATFLDRETAKIDALIAEQEKLIALLAEKRQATISHAVTRGLDPHAPMKDSGVAWLGQVPAHWSIRPLKHIARLVTGTTPPTDDESNYSEEGHPWIRPEDLDETGAASVATKFLSPGGLSVSRVVQPGAVLICCIGTIGKVGQTETTASTNQQITSAEFVGHRRYFFYVTSAARTEFEQSATGNVLKILNSERLGRVSYPIPDREEQIKIAEYLDNETSKIDALMGSATKAIVLLSERRSALIAAAVTGQIDVRGTPEIEPNSH